MEVQGKRGGGREDVRTEMTGVIAKIYRFLQIIDESAIVVLLKYRQMDVHCGGAADRHDGREHKQPSTCVCKTNP